MTVLGPDCLCKTILKPGLFKGQFLVAVSKQFWALRNYSKMWVLKTCDEVILYWILIRRGTLNSGGFGKLGSVSGRPDLLWPDTTNCVPIFWRKNTLNLSGCFRRSLKSLFFSCVFCNNICLLPSLCTQSLWLLWKRLLKGRNSSRKILTIYKLDFQMQQNPTKQLWGQEYLCHQLACLWGLFLPLPQLTISGVWYITSQDQELLYCENLPPSHPGLFSLKQDEVDKNVKNVISHQVCLNKQFWKIIYLKILLM